MKKTLFFAMLMALGFGVASCDSDSDEPNWGDFEEVDVELGTKEEQTFKSEDERTRTLVTPTGATSWDNNDQVMIIDVDGVAKTFNYDGNKGQTMGRFLGKLLGGQGLKTYYAYHNPEEINCTLSNYVLTINREDISWSQNGGFRTTDFGKYCPMVAVPAKFDINDKSKTVEFHHATSLIEGSITCKTPDCFSDVNYNKAIFTVTALNGVEPFNNEVSINLKNVTGKPDNDVSIPFTEGNVKTATISTLIKYKNVENLQDQVDNAEIGRYNFPIFALPTKIDFKFKATIEFFMGDVLVCTLESPDGAGFAGLNPAGLNVLPFTEEHRVNP